MKRFFLRFGFVYLFFQMVPFSASLLPFVQPAMRPYEALWESVSVRVGRRVFGITVDLVQNGSGDKAYFYVWAFCHLVLAVLLGLVWTIFDRKRSRDPRRYGILAPKSPLYGIWEVEELALEGRVRPPLLTDAERWRYLIFEHPRFLVLHTMNDESRGEYYGVELDTTRRTMTLSSGEPPKKSALSYLRPEPDVLTLDGTFEGRRLQARLRRIDESKFLLVSRGFHWINETPFNR